MIDSLSVNLISLDQAVARLAAADREEADERDFALAHQRTGVDHRKRWLHENPGGWSKRERAIARLYNALCGDELIALVRDPVSGALIRLISHGWQGAAFWRDTIVGGNIRSQPGEGVALYDGWSVVLERSEFERWAGAEAPSVVEPAVDRTQKSASKSADEAVREALTRICEEALAIGDKVPNVNQAFSMVTSRVKKLGFSISRDDFRHIANEDNFRAMRLKPGQRHKK